MDGILLSFQQSRWSIYSFRGNDQNFWKISLIHGNLFSNLSKLIRTLFLYCITNIRKQSCELSKTLNFQTASFRRYQLRRWSCRASSSCHQQSYAKGTWPFDSQSFCEVVFPRRSHSSDLQWQSGKFSRARIRLSILFIFSQPQPAKTQPFPRKSQVKWRL